MFSVLDDNDSSLKELELFYPDTHQFLPSSGIETDLKFCSFIPSD